MIFSTLCIRCPHLFILKVSLSCVAEPVNKKMEFSLANISAISDLLKTEEPDSDSDDDMKVHRMWMCTNSYECVQTSMNVRNF